MYSVYLHRVPEDIIFDTFNVANLSPLSLWVGRSLAPWGWGRMPLLMGVHLCSVVQCIPFSARRCQCVPSLSKLGKAKGQGIVHGWPRPHCRHRGQRIRVALGVAKSVILPGLQHRGEKSRFLKLAPPPGLQHSSDKSDFTYTYTHLYLYTHA